jgi:hypothetical protein
MGSWNGYVGVPAHHPFWQGREDQIPVEVHGGLTYSDPDLPCQLGDDERKPIYGVSMYVWWLGFDCGHAGDYQPRYEAEMDQIWNVMRLTHNLTGLRSRSLLSMIHSKKGYKRFDWVAREVDYLQRQLERLP